MSIRTRKFIGTVALVTFLIVYCLLAMVIGATWYGDSSLHTKMLYYILAGIGWVFPAMPLIWWMQRP